jgi:dCMP deaminase
VNYFADVDAFHEKFGLPRGGQPHVLDPDQLQFRVRFMQEELDEFVACSTTGDLPGAADGIADLVYVALGTAVMMGIPMDDVWREVQRANMSKVRANGADDERSTRKHSLDVVKPEGWRPPDVAGAILSGALRRMGRTRRFLDLAHTVAQWSKDPTTKVGAVIVGDDPRKIAMGYNGFPPGIADTPDRLVDRPTKHKLMQHAERNALDNATFDTRGATLYCTLAPCVSCAKSIISKGISRVVCSEVPTHAPWNEEARDGRLLLEEAGVKYETS